MWTDKDYSQTPTRGQRTVRIHGYTPSYFNCFDFLTYEERTDTTRIARLWKLGISLN